MKTLVLTDGKAGHENQSRAFAAAISGAGGFEVAPVRFKSPLCKILSYALDRIGVCCEGLLEYGSHSPADVVVGAGSGTFYAAKTLARRQGCKCAAILYPRGYRLGGFDCILAPSFDNPARRGNVVELPVNIVAGGDAFYEAGVASFRERHVPPSGGRKAAAAIIGGPNKRSFMSADWMKERLDGMFAATEGMERWVTTSRRTPPEVEKVVESYPWDYALIYSKDSYNPIPAFVSLAERLYVTAESTGMLSEACSRGNAEVRVFDNLAPGGHKFRRFLESLRAGGYVDGRRKADLGECFARAKALLGA